MLEAVFFTLIPYTSLPLVGMARNSHYFNLHEYARSCNLSCLDNRHVASNMGEHVLGLQQLVRFIPIRPGILKRGQSDIFSPLANSTAVKFGADEFLTGLN